MVGTSIDERSELTNRRAETGHLKIDTVRSGRGTKAILLTVADRATRLLAITKLDSLSQRAVLEGFSGLISDSPAQFKL